LKIRSDSARPHYVQKAARNFRREKRIGPTAVNILKSRKPNRTVVRITCGDEIGQFVVARPRVDVLLFFATAVPAPLLI